MLIVGGYRDTKFPKWLASASEFLPNVVSLCLCDCPNIVSLPLLGQLPSLQKLTIEGLNGIKVIGEELYGNGSSIAPFHCLSYLKISFMKKWEEWDICYEGEIFPCLEQLHVFGCSRLKKSLPRHLHCLKKLHIEHCGNLEATLPKSSCMEELSLSCCEKITVKDMPTWSTRLGMLSSLQRLSIQWGSKVIASCRDWGLHELLSLKELKIGGIEDMECFPEEGLLPPNLHLFHSFVVTI
ncbi:hypothetical protein K1719_013749 [Acacia pycnantha]|nr:hypothetical protein K1719_013749 [Acacia pycnantha]